MAVFFCEFKIQSVAVFMAFIHREFRLGLVHLGHIHIFIERYDLVAFNEDAIICFEVDPEAVFPANIFKLVRSPIAIQD